MDWHFTYIYTYIHWPNFNSNTLKRKMALKHFPKIIQVDDLFSVINWSVLLSVRKCVPRGVDVVVVEEVCDKTTERLLFLCLCESDIRAVWPNHSHTARLLSARGVWAHWLAGARWPLSCSEAQLHWAKSFKQQRLVLSATMAAQASSGQKKLSDYKQLNLEEVD